MGKGQDLYIRAKKVIPGGTQLLSKRPEMFLPNLWPAYYTKAKGCEIWDLDGKKYIDMSYMGIGTCMLGYADNNVNTAVISAIRSGNMATLNAPEEVELAEVLLSLHPWADMVRYARSGGESMAVAVRIARAYTRRDVVLFCGYHGWHDWYLSANLSSNKALDGHLLPGLNPLGVPRKLCGTAYPFKYNDCKGFMKLATRFKGKIGVIVLEPIRNHYPGKKFIDTVMNVARDLHAVLISDEITSGFRLTLGGAHMIFGLKPDIAVFAKGISNGYPMAAIIGKESIMQKAQETFISSTYWTDRIGPVSALATIKKLKEKKVPIHLANIGKIIQEGWKRKAAQYNFAIEVDGIYPLSHFSFTHKNYLALKTLFTQLMLEKGFLASTAFYASYAHKDTHCLAYLDAVDDTFKFIAKAISKDRIEHYVKSALCHSGFKRLT